MALPPAAAGRGPYEQTVVAVATQVAKTRPDFTASTTALGVPPWVADHLAAETGATLLTRPGQLPVLHLGPSLVVAVPDLDEQPFGRFVVQDLLDGDSHDLPFRCHPDVPPDRWEALSLAVLDGIGAPGALTLATLAP